MRWTGLDHLADLPCHPIEIFGDGEQVRDFTYVGDAVAALRRAMAVASTEAPVVNVCTGTGTSVRELAEIIAGLCDTPLVVRQSGSRLKRARGTASSAPTAVAPKARRPPRNERRVSSVIS